MKNYLLNLQSIFPLARAELSRKENYSHFVQKYWHYPESLSKLLPFLHVYKFNNWRHEKLSANLLAYFASAEVNRRLLKLPNSLSSWHILPRAEIH
jgi:hypothetical protein